MQASVQPAGAKCTGVAAAASERRFSGGGLSCIITNGPNSISGGFEIITDHSLEMVAAAP